MIMRIIYRDYHLIYENLQNDYLENIQKRKDNLVTPRLICGFDDKERLIDENTISNRFYFWIILINMYFTDSLIISCCLPYFMGLNCEFQIVVIFRYKDI